MNDRLVGGREYLSVTVALLLVFCFLGSPALAQKSSEQGGAGAKKPAGSAGTSSHMVGGHPDLNGYWETGGLRANITQVGGVTKVFNGPGPLAEGAAAPRRPTPELPPYKAELVAKTKELYDSQSKTDPAFFCKPLGLPRIGPPLQIVQTPQMIVFFYQPDAGAGDAGGITTRIIPIDGRPHRADADPSFFGDSIGHWDGDTLVVDVINFNEDTWLGNPGYFHSRKLHVVERLRRDGESLSYQATVEDPEVLSKPWILNPRTLKLGTGVVEETPPCEERDQSHLVNTDHH